MAISPSSLAVVEGLALPSNRAACAVVDEEVSGWRRVGVNTSRAELIGRDWIYLRIPYGYSNCLQKFEKCVISGWIISKPTAMLRQYKPMKN
ncbi:hypothetical protein KSP39_PZI015758 [Platanthera zijinensis]|uniref:Uncharacterized protein n=1 Tax=Platanthera zijinensis TaxID=2320716 RepID=A0AAP0G1F6_9ASPA